MFLLSEGSQIMVINKVSSALKPGDDAMIDQPSISLGTHRYRELIAASGLSLIDEFKDEGGNYYFSSRCHVAWLSGDGLFYDNGFSEQSLSVLRVQARRIGSRVRCV